MLLAAALAACGDNGGGGEASSKTTVVASFYPLAYAAQEIGGGHVTVRNLTAPGAEPHELELSPHEVDAVESADLVLVLGRDFQPAVERVAKRNANTVALIDDLDVRGDDPHVWLDPRLMIGIVNRVAAAFTKLDPGHTQEYETRAAVVRVAVTELDDRYRTGLATCKRHEVVTAHKAFGRMAARYGLTQKAIAGLSPESEPNPARMAELADEIRRDGVTTVFTEELVSPRVAEALAREVGVRTEVLNPIEGLTKDEAAHGATYVTVMDTNLKKLQSALECR